MLRRSHYVCGALLLMAAITLSGFAAAGEVQYAKDTPVVPMAEWEIVQKGAAEQTGARVLIAAGAAELGRAPAGASRYDSQTFRFPSGDMRVLSFRKASGGVLHQITTETQIYVAKGSASVDVAGVRTEIAAGDVVNLPSGILRNGAAGAEDTVIIAHTVASAPAGAKASVVRGKDNPEAVIESGEKAGVGGARVTVQRYAFEGNSIRVARLSGNGQTSPAIPKVDALIYLLSGRMKLHLGNEVFEVAAGDALREPAGVSAHWEVTEPASFVATNGAGPASTGNRTQ